MDHASYIVDEIERCRRCLGMSVAELGRRADIDRKRLWCILNHKRSLQADELVRLSLALGLGLRRFVPPDMAARLEAARRKLVEDYGTGAVS